MHQGLPFEVKIPNADTVEALRQGQAGSNLVKYSTLEDLKDTLLAAAPTRPLIAPHKTPLGS